MRAALNGTDYAPLGRSNKLTAYASVDEAAGRYPPRTSAAPASTEIQTMKILLIEDDRETSAYLFNGLQEEGHTVQVVENGRDGLILATSEDYDVLIVDRMLPGVDGLSIVKTIRGAGNQVPVLFLTTMNGIDDRVEGLDAGGDDYLVKPFAFSELRARVNALIRRPSIVREETVLQVVDLEMDLIARSVCRAGKKIELGPMEFRLLEYLMRNKGRVVTRTMLLERVWEFNFEPKTKVVEANISRLRTKIDKPFSKQLLHTVRGSGYVLKSAGETG